MVEQTLCTSETITHWTLASNRQLTVSHTCRHVTVCLLQHVQTTSYRPPATHICRLVLSYTVVWYTAKGVGDAEIRETYLNSASKNASETDIFPHATKSLLTSDTYMSLCMYVCMSFFLSEISFQEVSVSRVSDLFQSRCQVFRTVTYIVSLAFNHLLDYSCVSSSVLLFSSSSSLHFSPVLLFIFFPPHLARFVTSNILYIPVLHNLCFICLFLQHFFARLMR